MSEHKLMTARKCDEYTVQGLPVWEVQGYGTVTDAGCEVRPPWFDVRLTLPDGARVDVLAVVRGDAIAIEDAQADPPLPLAGLAALASALDAPLQAACASVTSPTTAPSATTARYGRVAPDEDEPDQGTPGSGTSGHDAPGQEARGSDTPERDALGRDAPGQGTPSSGTSGQDAPSQGTPGRAGVPEGETGRPAASAWPRPGGCPEPLGAEPSAPAEQQNLPAGQPTPPAVAPAPAPFCRPGQDAARAASAPAVPEPASEAPGGRHRGRGSAPWGSARRRDVAGVYRAAQARGEDPVLAVMAATGFSRRRSLRLIAGARDEGRLPSRRRRA
ncbi:DUF6214 family protein [Streptomyces sp. DW26H14]|uniref:DUF6214 family protein n=1 Tax=Streptomyces sp. DW26H14 TaxID=3435395 RepID=UPI00403E0D85